MNFIETLADDCVFAKNAEELWKLASSFESDFFIVNFFANWCFPCKKIKSTLSSVQVNSRVVLFEINVDELSYIAKSELFSVNKIPTLFIFKKGKLLFRVNDSSISKFDLEKILNS